MGCRKFPTNRFIGNFCPEAHNVVFFFNKIKNKKYLTSFINQRTRAVCSKETMLQIYVRIYSIQTLSMTCLTTTLVNFCAAQLASKRTKIKTVRVSSTS